MGWKSLELSRMEPHIYYWSHIYLIVFFCPFIQYPILFLQNSKIPTYEKMWNFMSQNEDVFVNTSELGIAKVKAGKYVVDTFVA